MYWNQSTRLFPKPILTNCDWGVTIAAAVAAVRLRRLRLLPPASRTAVLAVVVAVTIARSTGAAGWKKWQRTSLLAPKDGHFIYGVRIFCCRYFVSIVSFASFLNYIEYVRSIDTFCAHRKKSVDTHFFFLLSSTNSSIAFTIILSLQLHSIYSHLYSSSRCQFFFNPYINLYVRNDGRHSCWSGVALLDLAAGLRVCRGALRFHRQRAV